MNINTLKALWAGKLLKSRYFILITDKEAAMQLRGLNPKKTEDLIALSQQAASLDMFKDQLDDVIGDHNKYVEMLGGKKRVTKARKPRAKKTTK